MTPLTTNNQLLTQLERLVIDHFGFHPQAPTFPFLVQKGIFLPTKKWFFKTHSFAIILLFHHHMAKNKEKEPNGQNNHSNSFHSTN